MSLNVQLILPLKNFHVSVMQCRFKNLRAKPYSQVPCVLFFHQVLSNYITHDLRKGWTIVRGNVECRSASINVAPGLKYCIFGAKERVRVDISKF